MGYIADAAKSENRLTTLRILRDRLAVEIDDSRDARTIAALSQRLMDVLEQIAAAEKAQPERKGTPLDELAARRRRAAG